MFLGTHIINIKIFVREAYDKNVAKYEFLFIQLAGLSHRGIPITNVTYSLRGKFKNLSY